jgi:hypothetical protein
MAKDKSAKQVQLPEKGNVPTNSQSTEKPFFLVDNRQNQELDSQPITFNLHPMQCSVSLFAHHPTPDISHP